MNYKTAKKIFFIAVLCICTCKIMAQVNYAGFNAPGNQPLQEKIFVHTDKNFYITGEILWFKLYDVSADSLKPLNLSNIAYIEILNAQNKPVLQSMVALHDGSGNGSFYLPSSITSGNYIFRSYTNWMKNSSADLYFHKQITIINTLTRTAGKANNDPVNYEIGFYPEGGNLVSNMESKVGIKLMDDYGNGVNGNGNIVDENNQTITSFSTLKSGMGSFYFTPKEDHTYTAAVTINGKTFNKPLPTAQTKGYVMHVNSNDANQVTITVNTNTDIQKTVYLIAYANNNIKAALVQTTDANGSVTFTMQKNNLPDGITHLIVFNNEKQPQCERLIFIKPQTLQLNLNTDNSVYSKRSQVKLNTDAGTDADLSVAVYLVDSLQNEDEDNILNCLWLTSELKGRIESPQYYFNNTGAEADAALENLLLTQGWSKFKQNETQNTQPLFHFAPEIEGHIIEGKVTDKTSGLPADNIRVYLSVPGQHFRFATSLSNNGGKVFFDVKDYYGSGELIVQTAKEDSMYRVEIADPFSNQFSGSNVTSFNFFDKNLQALTAHNLAMQVQNAYNINQINLFSSPALDSNAFYGKPDEQYYLDNYTRFNTMEEVLREYVANVNVRIRQGGYSLAAVDLRNHVAFDTNPLVLVDGVPVFDMNKLIAYNPLKIKKTEVLLRKVYYNSYTANGIVSYSTYKGDLDGFQLDPGTIELSYDGLQLEREFYSPQYINAEQKQGRLPDYRNVLYWAPQVNTKDKTQLSFYTSDINGKYIAVIQGIGANGKAGYSTTMFQVK